MAKAILFTYTYSMFVTIFLFLCSLGQVAVLVFCAMTWSFVR